MRPVIRGLMGPFEVCVLRSWTGVLLACFPGGWQCRHFHRCSGYPQASASAPLTLAGGRLWGTRVRSPARLKDLEPAKPVLRYEHDRPGDLIHLDTKKLGRIERIGHRITGRGPGQREGAGWETLFVAIDDHARIAFTDMYPA